MSLWSTQHKVNNSGKDVYMSQRERIMREAKEHSKIIHLREIDNQKREISSKRLEYQRILGRVSEIKRELMSLRTKKTDQNIYREIQEKERTIRLLESDKLKLDHDIRKIDFDIKSSQNKYFK